MLMAYIYVETLEILLCEYKVSTADGRPDFNRPPMYNRIWILTLPSAIGGAPSLTPLSVDTQAIRILLQVVNFDVRVGARCQNFGGVRVLWLGSRPADARHVQRWCPTAAGQL